MQLDIDKKRQDDAMSRYRRFADAVGGEEEFGKFVEKFMDSEESMSRFRKFMDGAADEDDGKSDGKDDDKREMTAMASQGSAGLWGPPVSAIPAPSEIWVTSQPPAAQNSGRRRRSRFRYRGIETAAATTSGISASQPVSWAEPRTTPSRMMNIAARAGPTQRTVATMRSRSSSVRQSHE